jgi:hypothetical protein
VLLEAATLVSLVTVLAGGVRSRAYGWKVVCALMALAAAAQLASMAIVVGFASAFCWMLLTEASRRTSLITTSGSSLVGSWMYRGSFAQSAGASSRFPAWE